MKSLKIAIMVVSTASLAGCISYLNVKKIDADNKKTTEGVRYFLPQVFIQVTPNQDGSVSVEKIYLPDPAHEYAISTGSFLGGYALDINRNEKGFLETVSFNTDSSSITKQLIQSASNLEAAKIDTEYALLKAQKAEEKTSAEKQSALISTADKAQKDAQIALDVATSKLDYLKEIKINGGGPTNINDQILSAELLVKELTIKRDAATVNLGTVSENLSAANASSTQPLAIEPTFLRVSMSENSVSLIQDFEQSDRETWNIPKAQEPNTTWNILPDNFYIQPSAKDPMPAVTVKSDKALKAVALVRLFQGDGIEIPNIKANVSLQSDKTSIAVTLPKKTPDGEYYIDMKLTTTDKKPVEVTKTIMVTIER